MDGPRRAAVARRDEILCQLARRFPPKQGDSPQGVARCLKQMALTNFRGLDETIPDNGERLVFEQWVRATNESSIARRVQRAFTAGQGRPPRPDIASAPPEIAPIPLSLPSMLWPYGMRQRKDRSPQFKLPFLYSDSGGSERVFLECVGEEVLYDVSVTILGRKIGYWPAVRPGTLLELAWKEDAKLKASVTQNGWRDHILNYESFKDLAGDVSPDDISPATEFANVAAKFAAKQVAQTQPHMPPNLEDWKTKVWAYRLKVTYRRGGGKVAGGLTGCLLMTMERLWFRFKDDKGNETQIV